jgi:hypothetical protein
MFSKTQLLGWLSVCANGRCVLLKLAQMEGRCPGFICIENALQVLHPDHGDAASRSAPRRTSGNGFFLRKFGLIGFAGLAAFAGGGPCAMLAV